METSNKVKEKVFFIIFSILQVYLMATVYMQTISPVFQIIFWAVIVVSFTGNFLEIAKKKRKFSKMEILYFLYIIYIGFSLFRVKDFSLSVYGIYEYIFFTLPFFSVVFLLKKEILETNLANKLIELFSILTFFLVSLGLFEFKMGYPIAGGVTHSFTEESLINIRAQVFSGSPLIFGTLMACYGLFFQYQTIKKGNNKYILFLLFSFIGILLSGSRGPLVAFILSATFQTVSNIQIKKIWNKISKKNKIYFFLIVFILLVCFYVLIKKYEGQSPILLKIISIVNWESDIGNTTRLVTWTAFFKEFLDNWLIGRGISTTGSVTLHHPLNIGPTESSVLKLLVELGIIGFLLYFGMIFYTLLRGFKRIQNQQLKYRKEIILGLSLIILILTESSILQITEIFNATVILWASAGLVYTLTKQENQLVTNNSQRIDKYER